MFGKWVVLTPRMPKESFWTLYNDNFQAPGVPATTPSVPSNDSYFALAEVLTFTFY